jgi:hypothetical protein
MLELLDPTDERVPVRRTLATRQATLDGAIGLLDISKPRGDVFLARLAERLAERLPGVTVRTYQKPTFTRPAPDDLRRRIAEECTYVIEALAD